MACSWKDCGTFTYGVGRSTGRGAATGGMHDGDSEMGYVFSYLLHCLLGGTVSSATFLQHARCVHNQRIVAYKKKDIFSEIIMDLITCS